MARRPCQVTPPNIASPPRLTGTVTRVANIGEQRPNSDAKVFEVAVAVAHSDTTLRPAMTTSNTIIVAEIEQALYVPLETLHARDSLTFAFVDRDGRVGRQEVALGLMNENEAIIESGLLEDDRLYLSVPSDTSGVPWWPLEGNRDVALAETPVTSVELATD